MSYHVAITVTHDAKETPDDPIDSAVDAYLKPLGDEVKAFGRTLAKETRPSDAIALANEVKGAFGIAGAEIRAAIGNTNANCMLRRAGAVLGERG